MIFSLPSYIGSLYFILNLKWSVYWKKQEHVERACVESQQAGYTQRNFLIVRRASVRKGLYSSVKTIRAKSDKRSVWIKSGCEFIFCLLSYCKVGSYYILLHPTRIVPEHISSKCPLDFPINPSLFNKIRKLFVGTINLSSGNFGFISEKLNSSYLLDLRYFIEAAIFLCMSVTYEKPANMKFWMWLPRQIQSKNEKIESKSSRSEMLYFYIFLGMTSDISSLISGHLRWFLYLVRHPYQKKNP